MSIKTKQLCTLEDFKSVKEGDWLAVEWKLDSYIGNKRTRFAVYQVIEVKERLAEIILQRKNNVYFNYLLFLDLMEGCSNAKRVTLISSNQN